MRLKLQELVGRESRRRLGGSFIFYFAYVELVAGDYCGGAVADSSEGSVVDWRSAASTKGRGCCEVVVGGCELWASEKLQKIAVGGWELNVLLSCKGRGPAVS
ncbi:hypothetical protein M758_UG229600 [Ceratodon purpureus]|nr:hypothetical protein M758_UG229600 [Ceratodon purpureus]